jgi:hypothetical protein
LRHREIMLQLFVTNICWSGLAIYFEPLFRRRAQRVVEGPRGALVYDSRNVLL